MKRAIVAPAILAGAALDELKQWLAIGTSGEDAMLTDLLRAALELCEAFTGQMPLEAVCEEVLSPAGGWQGLNTRPVQAMTGVEAIAADGSRTALAPGDYAFDLGADGSGRLRLLRQPGGVRIAVRFTAGLASTWDALPDTLRQGVLRLSAYHYRERDIEPPAMVPPAAVAALWRPWRRMRLT